MSHYADPPAFPRAGYYPATNDVHREDLGAVLETATDPQAGMTLRDFFAAHALAGLIVANGNAGEAAIATDARLALAYADALLAAR